MVLAWSSIHPFEPGTQGDRHTNPLVSLGKEVIPIDCGGQWHGSAQPNPLAQKLYKSMAGVVHLKKYASKVLLYKKPHHMSMKFSPAKRSQSTQVFNSARGGSSAGTGSASMHSLEEMPNA
jgi:hypothetical protein